VTLPRNKLPQLDLRDLSPLAPRCTPQLGFIRNISENQLDVWCGSIEDDIVSMLPNQPSTKDNEGIDSFFSVAFPPFAASYATNP
jgi:hypothetical protein